METVFDRVERRKRHKSGFHRRGDVRRERVEVTPATQYAVYAGRERLGAYGRAGDAWVAFNRLGLPVGGFFDSERDAIDAIAEASR